VRLILERKRYNYGDDDPTTRNKQNGWQLDFPQAPTKAKVERKRKSKAAKIARKQNRKG